MTALWGRPALVLLATLLAAANAGGTFRPYQGYCEPVVFWESGPMADQQVYPMDLNIGFIAPVSGSINKISLNLGSLYGPYDDVAASIQRGANPPYDFVVNLPQFMAEGAPFTVYLPEPFDVSANDAVLVTIFISGLPNVAVQVDSQSAPVAKFESECCSGPVSLPPGVTYEVACPDSLNNHWVEVSCPVETLVTSTPSCPCTDNNGDVRGFEVTDGVCVCDAGYSGSESNVCDIKEPSCVDSVPDFNSYNITDLMARISGEMVSMPYIQHRVPFSIMRSVEAQLGYCLMGYFSDHWGESFREIVPGTCETRYKYFFHDFTMSDCALWTGSNIDPATGEWFYYYEAPFSVEITDYLDDFLDVPIKRVTHYSVFVANHYPLTLTQRVDGTILTGDPVVQAVLTGVSTDAVLGRVTLKLMASVQRPWLFSIGTELLKHGDSGAMIPAAFGASGPLVGLEHDTYEWTIDLDTSMLEDCGASLPYSFSVVVLCNVSNCPHTSPQVAEVAFQVDASELCQDIHIQPTEADCSIRFLDPASNEWKVKGNFGIEGTVTGRLNCPPSTTPTMTDAVITLVSDQSSYALWDAATGITQTGVDLNFQLDTVDNDLYFELTLDMSAVPLVTSPLEAEFGVDITTSMTVQIEVGQGGGTIRRRSLQGESALPHGESAD